MLGVAVGVKGGQCAGYGFSHLTRNARRGRYRASASPFGTNVRSRPVDKGVVPPYDPRAVRKMRGQGGDLQCATLRSHVTPNSQRESSSTLDPEGEGRLDRPSSLGVPSISLSS